MDEGLKLAQVLQRLEDDSFWWTDIQSIQELLEMCENGASRLDTIKVQHIQGVTQDEIRKAKSPASDRDAIQRTESGSQTGNRLVLRLTASGIQLGFCEAAHCVMQKVLESSYYGITHSGGRHWKIIDPESYKETQVIVLEDGIQLAKEIVKTTDIIFTEFGEPELPPEAIRLLFPLKMASRMLKYCKSTLQYAQCDKYIHYLSGTKGSTFTKTTPKEHFVYGGSRQKNVAATEAL